MALRSIEAGRKEGRRMDRERIKKRKYALYAKGSLR
jgi:hypothetical protein